MATKCESCKSMAQATKDRITYKDKLTLAKVTIICLSIVLCVALIVTAVLCDKFIKKTFDLFNNSVVEEETEIIDGGENGAAIKGNGNTVIEGDNNEVNNGENNND